MPGNRDHRKGFRRARSSDGELNTPKYRRGQVKVSARRRNLTYAGGGGERPSRQDLRWQRASEIGSLVPDIVGGTALDQSLKTTQEGRSADQHQQSHLYGEGQAGGSDRHFLHREHERGADVIN